MEVFVGGLKREQPFCLGIILRVLTYLKDVFSTDPLISVGNKKMKLCLSFLVLSSQAFMACSIAIGDELKVTKKEGISFEGNKTETPSFLSKFYEELVDKNEAHGKANFLESFQAQWNQETDEFLLPPHIKAQAGTIRKAEIFLSTHELGANKKLTVSIHETRTGVKMSSQQLTSHRSDWLSLPVTRIVKQWIARKDAPLRFKVFVKTSGGFATAITDDVEIPKVWLVVYSEAQQGQAFPYLALNLKTSGSSGSRMRRDNSPSKMAASENPCRKEDMVIESFEFGKTEKVIYPKSFNAYQCSGNCSSNTGKARFINHSILKAFMSQKNGIKGKDGSCCIPSKLKPITLILITDKKYYLIKTIRDIIVEECGCY